MNEATGYWLHVQWPYTPDIVGLLTISMLLLCSLIMRSIYSVHASPDAPVLVVTCTWSLLVWAHQILNVHVHVHEQVSLLVHVHVSEAVIHSLAVCMSASYPSLSLPSPPPPPPSPSVSPQPGPLHSLLLGHLSCGGRGAGGLLPLHCRSHTLNSTILLPQIVPLPNTDCVCIYVVVCSNVHSFICQLTIVVAITLKLIECGH